MVSEQAIWTHNRKLFGKQNNRKAIYLQCITYCIRLARIKLD